MAVPPLSANTSCRAMKGNVRTSSSTCLTYCSRAIGSPPRQEISRDRDAIRRMKPTTWSESPVAASHVDSRHVYVLAPGVRVFVGIDEEQAFDLHAKAA